VRNPIRRALRGLSRYADTSKQLLRLEAEQAHALRKLAEHVEISESVKEICGDHGIDEGFGISLDQTISEIVCDLCVELCSVWRLHQDELATAGALRLELSVAHAALSEARDSGLESSREAERLTLDLRAATERAVSAEEITRESARRLRAIRGSARAALICLAPGKVDRESARTMLETILET